MYTYIYVFYTSVQVIPWLFFFDSQLFSNFEVDTFYKLYILVLHNYVGTVARINRKSNSIRYTSV